MRIRGAGLLLVVLTLVLSSPVWSRTWTDTTGRYTIEADLVEVKDGNAMLKKPDGNVVAVPIARLSRADRQYLDSRRPADGGAKPSPPVPPELKVLGLRVGTWEGKMTVKPAELTPDGGESRFTEVVEWILDGRFIRGRAIQDGKIEHFWLCTYDARQKAYRLWQFDSFGNFPLKETVGEWNEITDTMLWTHTVEGGYTSTQTIHFTGNDAYEITIVDKGPDGKVYLDLAGKAVRKK
jgi:hypothetical protein